MAKFKIGDRVKFVNAIYSCDPRFGWTGTIQEECSIPNIRWDEDPEELDEVMEHKIELLVATPRPPSVSTSVSPAVRKLADDIRALPYRDLVALVDAINEGDAEIDEEDLLAAADRILGAG